MQTHHRFSSTISGAAFALLIALFCLFTACVGVEEPAGAGNASEPLEPHAAPTVSPTVAPYTAGYKQCNAESCVVLASDLPVVPDRMMVYRLANRMTLDNATAIARALKMNGTVTEYESGYEVEEGRRHLGIEKYDGQIRYSDESEWTSPDPLSVPGAVPSENETIEGALDFMRSNGILPSNEYIALRPNVSPIGITVNGTDSSGNTVSLVYEGWRVQFKPTIDGYPSVGRASFEIGGTGDILALEGDWRDYRPFREYPVVSPEEIYNRVVDHPLPDTGANSTSSIRIQVQYLTSRDAVASEVHTEKTYLRPFYLVFRRMIVDGKPWGNIDLEYIPAIPELGEYSLKGT